MPKETIKKLGKYQTLYRDSKSGIAWVEDGSAGVGHSAHPNIYASGSVSGMRSLGYWGKRDLVVKSHGFIYNIDHVSISDSLDEIARDHCQCGGKH